VIGSRATFGSVAALAVTGAVAAVLVAACTESGTQLDSRLEPVGASQSDRITRRIRRSGYADAMEIVVRGSRTLAAGVNAYAIEIGLTPGDRCYGIYIETRVSSSVGCSQGPGTIEEGANGRAARYINGLVPNGAREVELQYPGHESFRVSVNGPESELFPNWKIFLIAPPVPTISSSVIVRSKDGKVLWAIGRACLMNPEWCKR
jgi:hypothetical protein